jgi:DNA-binding CsgD family transcriptional regulator
MLTPKEQAVLDLRQQGLSSKQSAARLGISRNAEKFRAWCGRQRLASGDPLILPGTYCVFKYADYIGVLPLHCLPDWLDRVWRARKRLPWFAGLDRRPKVEILLGGTVPLTAREASVVRRLLAGKRNPGIYKIGRRGKVTFYPGERTASRAEGVSSMAIRYRRERGHGQGYYWL